MRALTLPERKILGHIIHDLQNLFSTNLANIIDDGLQDVGLHLDFNARTAEIRLDRTVYSHPDAIIEVVQFTLRDTVLAVKLLEYLSENGYIVMFSQAQPGNTSDIGSLVVGNPFVTSQIVDQEIVDKLLNLAPKNIMILQPLIDYVNNDYRTPDEVIRDQDNKRAEAEANTNSMNLKIAQNEAQKNSTNLRIALIALVLSILFGIVETYYASQEVKYGKMQVEQEQTVKIDSVQTEEMQKLFNEQNSLIRNNILIMTKLDSSLTKHLTIPISSKLPFGSKRK